VVGRGNWKVTLGEEGEWGLGCFLRMKGEGCEGVGGLNGVDGWEGCWEEGRQV
jgi:hypothetical protein